MKALKEFLAEHQISSKENCTLAELTSFKIGGKADIVLYPETPEQCAALIRYAGERKKPLVWLGNGSNILASDEGCRRWILKTERLAELSLDNKGVLTVGAGVRLVKVSSFAAKNGYTGLEFAYGIPGTVGGAVFMNAGAYGGAMDQVVQRTFYLDENGDDQVLEGEAHLFGYRNSFFMRHPEYLIVGTELRLQKGDPEKIMTQIDTLQRQRKEKQPLEYPSAGSVFKRPANDFAGRLIQEAGLRGYRIGDAQVSEKHCGFIVNRGRATCADVKNLISYVQKEVLKQSGVQLECEVRCLEAE